MHGQPTNFAWDRLNRLRAISIVQMAILAPFFTAWTIYGSVLFIKINSGAVECDSPHQSTESYAFLIFWFILSYVLIFSYICLIFYGYS